MKTLVNRERSPSDSVLTAFSALTSPRGIWFVNLSDGFHNLDASGNIQG